MPIFEFLFSSIAHMRSTPVKAANKKAVFAGKNVNIASPDGWANGIFSCVDLYKK